MGIFIALLRAVNVGGTGKLPMAELKAMCAEIGFADARTYIASGNVVFSSALTAGEVKARLEARLAAHAGKPVGVMVRTDAEMARVLADNPFAGQPPSQVVAIFLDDAPPADALQGVTNRSGEDIALGAREIYVHYDQGMGQSRLTIPAARRGTARNMNTVAKLAAMAGA
ncbi:DUF1697 domain-containing protein [Pelagibacterium montanilacus]|uniref:DUF1697 domain-containing protein n=1 Tax=Pelagibacterium montanilacus TaxID=2185280 RepID=UPI000F8E88E6|nr:DUF1697 domain-containing protein [Pelagibacterium montanilacus]